MKIGGMGLILNPFRHDQVVVNIQLLLNSVQYLAKAKCAMALVWIYSEPLFHTLQICCPFSEQHLDFHEHSGTIVQSLLVAREYRIYSSSRLTKGTPQQDCQRLALCGVTERVERLAHRI